MAVITISREFGCGGEYVAERVAQKLGYKLFHKELIKYIAILTETDEETVNKFDEESHSNMRSFLSKYVDSGMFSNIFKDEDKKDKKVTDEYIKHEALSFFDTFIDTQPVFDSDRFVQMTEIIIKNLAAEKNCVIIGRGSQCILENEPNALHMRLVAPLQNRIEWIMNREKLSEKVARERVRDIEKRKKNFIKHYYDRDIEDIALYHATINMKKLEFDQVAEMIALTAGYIFKH
jgi:cytidylate kinase